MRGAIPPLPQYVFMAWCLVKHRDNFTFPFYAIRTVNIFSRFSNALVFSLSWQFLKITTFYEKNKFLVLQFQTCCCVSRVEKWEITRRKQLWHM